MSTRRTSLRRPRRGRVLLTGGIAVAGQDEPVARVAFWVDDPRAVVRLLRDRVVPAGR